MIVLDLCKQFCPDKIPVQAGELLGDGADGEIFTIVDSPTKVIKFSVIYDRATESPKEIYSNQIIPILDYVMFNKPTFCVRVYEHGFMGEFRRKVVSWKNDMQDFVIHYCIMERLHKLSEDEKKVFHSLVSHEDRNITKNLSPQKIKKICHGLALGLDFDAEKVILFCNQLRTTPLSHCDIHPRNIMKNASGYFKLIDLDRGELLPS